MCWKHVYKNGYLISDTLDRLISSFMLCKCHLQLSIDQSIPLAKSQYWINWGSRQNYGLVSNTMLISVAMYVHSPVYQAGIGALPYPRKICPLPFVPLWLRKWENIKNMVWLKLLWCIFGFGINSFSLHASGKMDKCLIDGSCLMNSRQV